MTRGARSLLYAVAAIAIPGLLAAASVVLALTAVGVFATAAPAWTTDLPVAGTTLRVSVVGLVRLATLPGVAHLLDGRAVETPHGRIAFSRHGAALQARCTPCRVHHRDLAATPVQFRSVTLGMRRDGDALEGTLAIDGATIGITGRLRASGIDLAWELAPTELAALVGALGDVVPEAEYARIEGRVAAQGRLALPARRGHATWSADALDVGGLGTERLQHGWFRFGCSQNDGSQRAVISGDGERTWVAGDSLGAYLPAAVVAAEDQRFHQHAGYDAEEIAALLATIDDGRPKRGASTITQQLARTLFTGGERTAARKLREWLYAIEMERTLGKPRILELYLNTVDWGPGLCGAKAAARAYFNKSPARLTPIEAAWLAGALRNPHAAWQRQFAIREPDHGRATLVLMQMRDWPKRERQRWAAQPLVFASPSIRRASPTTSAAAAQAGLSGAAPNR